MPSDVQRNHAHLMHSHLVDFLRDYLRRPELQVRSPPHFFFHALRAVIPVEGLYYDLLDAPVACWLVFVPLETICHRLVLAAD